MTAYLSRAANQAATAAARASVVAAQDDDVGAQELGCLRPALA
jgi:hypothetical protein